MDQKLKTYYADIQAVKEQIAENWVLVMSLQKPMRNMVGGCISEVSRDKAAQLIVDETHRRCTEEESRLWREEQDEARQKAAAEAAAARVTLVAVPPALGRSKADRDK